MITKWLEIRLAVPGPAVDLVAQKLVDIGCTGLTTADRHLDTFTAPDPNRLEDDPTLRAYFASPEDRKGFCRTVRRSLAELAVIWPGIDQIDLDLHELEDQDWATDWQQHFPPFTVGDRLLIHPSWDTQEVRPGKVALTLDPGQAFGTGTHATTSLCLDVLAEDLARTPAPARVLDVGTGSGILAMAAAALGAAEVVATDIDPQACAVARSNVAQNNLAGQITITSTPLEDVPGRFDLVLANILAAENLRLAEPLVAHLDRGGRLVLSGILTEQEDQILAGFAPYPLQHLMTRQRQEWSCIVYQRHD
ncbi:MAG: 50S ribosomal protein L11 methyltransferase [Desulfuromonadales bacterium]